MNSDTVRQVIANLRDPVNVKRRIHFTSRSIRFLTLLFEGKHIDVIDLHSIFLNLAYHAGSFSDEKKYVSLRDIVAYMMIDPPDCIQSEDVIIVGRQFDIDKDNEFHEVSDMLVLLST